MKGLEIRPALPEESEDICDVIHTAMSQYAKDSNIPGNLSSLDETPLEIYEYIKKDHVIAALYYNKIVACVRVSELNSETFLISRFSVLPAMQKLGLGSVLFSSAEQYIRMSGAAKAMLYTALSNVPAVRFYSSRGFELIKTTSERGYPRGLFEKRYFKE